MPRPNPTKLVAQLRSIRRSLSALDRALARLAGSVQVVATGTDRPRRKLTLTPVRRAALKLQGQYMGYLRNLKPKQKSQVKALREQKGIRAAIAKARGMGN